MAKRISASAINWAKMAERVPESQRQSFLAFKSRSDGYLRKVLANPENPPKIDWAAYKSKVPVAGLVDTFQKSYESLQIPYPTDTVSSQIDAQESQVKSEIDSFVKASKATIVDLQAQIAKLESLIPYSEMTMEEFTEAHPELAINPEKPTFWPHFPEEQPGYVDPNAAPEEEQKH